MDNAARCPPLAHRSAAAHKLHSARSNRYKIRESQNQNPGTGLSLFQPGDCPNERDHRISSSSPADSSKPNIAAYEKLLAKVEIDGHSLVAVFSIERHADGRQFYNAVTLEDGQEKPPVASPRDTPEQVGERATSANTGGDSFIHQSAQDSYGRPDQQEAGSSVAPIAGLDSFVRQPLRRVNPDSVSKVVDTATGLS